MILILISDTFQRMRSAYRPFWEKCLLFLVLFASFSLSVALYAKKDTLQKSQILRWELMNHRQEVIAYLLDYRTLPKSLEAIGKWTPLTDPLGHPYAYNPETGWVSSTTSQFTNW